MTSAHCRKLRMHHQKFGAECYLYLFKKNNPPPLDCMWYIKVKEKLIQTMIFFNLFIVKHTIYTE